MTDGRGKHISGRFEGIHTAFAPSCGVVPKAVMTTGRGLTDKANATNACQRR